VTVGGSFKDINVSKEEGIEIQAMESDDNVIGSRESRSGKVGWRNKQMDRNLRRCCFGLLTYQSELF